MKKIASITAILIAVYIISNFISSIYTQLHRKDILALTQKDLLDAQKENKELKAKLTQVQKPQFIQEEARNKLFLVKPGENPLILPGITITPTPPPQPKKAQKPLYQPILDFLSKPMSLFTQIRNLYK